MSTSHGSGSAVQYKSLGYRGHPGYRVGDDGTVWHYKRTLDKWKRLKGSVCKGYVSVILSTKYTRITVTVHRLVLEAFVSLRPEGMECCHFDGNRSNNALTNLRWDTKLANNEDKRRLGRTPAGERNYGVKLKADQVREIRRQFEAGATRKELQNLYSLSPAQTSKIVAGTSWMHLE